MNIVTVQMDKPKSDDEIHLPCSLIPYIYGNHKKVGVCDSGNMTKNKRKPKISTALNQLDR